MARGGFICEHVMAPHVHLTEVPCGPTGVPGLRSNAATDDGSPEAEVRVRELAEADLYWVSEPMCELLDEAAKTVPDDTYLPTDLFPSPSGFVVFERHLAGTSAFGEEPTVPVSAMHWWPCIRTVDQSQPEPWPEVDVDFYGYLAAPVNRLVFEGGATWPVGVRIDRFGDEDTEAQRASQLEDRRRLAAFILLLQSPGVVECSDVKHSRQAVRRAERHGRPLDAVRLINLRAGGTNGHGDGTHTFHHRWIVSGHWRNQPYGPQRSLRKPVWIAPHMKGPEGAPLLTGEKVRVL